VISDNKIQLDGSDYRISGFRLNLSVWKDREGIVQIRCEIIHADLADPQSGMIVLYCLSCKPPKTPIGRTRVECEGCAYHLSYDVEALQQGNCKLVDLFVDFHFLSVQSAARLLRPASRVGS
jgi:hypothetical protein